MATVDRRANGARTAGGQRRDFCRADRGAVIISEMNVTSRSAGRPRLHSTGRPRLPVAGERHERAAAIALNAALIVAWLALDRPVLDYLRLVFGREDFATNRWVLMGAGALVLRQAVRAGLRPSLAHPPRLRARVAALALALGGSSIYLAVERWLDINTLSALLCALASYGLLGLWLAPDRWRQGLPAALLLATALPFNEHLQTFIGYPARILSARIVASGLASAGAGIVDVGDILVLENGLAKVDLPCSGVKSLWSAAIFLLAATWIERRRLSGRWWLLAAAMVPLLLAVNIARIGALVLVGELGQRPLLAAMLHVPLGVLGFGGVCLLCWRLLLRLPVHTMDAWAPPLHEAAHREIAPDPEPRTRLAPRAGSRAGHLALVTAIGAFALLWSPRAPVVVSHPPAAAWSWPAELMVEALPLDPTEEAWFARDGADAVTRVRFRWQGAQRTLAGSMILVESRTWRAHHRPERCFEVYGLHIAASSPHVVAPDFPVRWVRLGGPSPAARGATERVAGEIGTAALGVAPSFSAVYWFQSPTNVTDDYGSRIWDDLRRTRRPWVLASMLFESPVEAGDPEVDQLLHLLRKTVDARADAIAHDPGSPPARTNAHRPSPTMQGVRP
jgi:exosortase O